jgi:hypothetical protein
MKCKVSFEFETEEQMIEWLGSKGPRTAMLETSSEVEAEDPTPEPEAPKAKAPKAKAPAVVETLNPEAPTQKECDKALALLVGKIRVFVLADKSTNMKALLPLMPEGKKALDKLTLEEAQGITLKLGIE